MTTNTSITEAWLATNTGRQIDLLNPDHGQITIEDVANNLSKICRFNGQLKQFYSVAQHCMYVAYLVPAPLKLQALLHDAPEAYICDIPSPLKRLLGDTYRDIEERMERAISAALGGRIYDLHPTVKQADTIMVVSERDALQFNPTSWGEETDSGLRYPNFTPAAISTDAVATMYIDAYNRYKDYDLIQAM